MIRHPIKGQTVQAWYAADKRPIARYHGMLGIVRIVSDGKNHGVEFGGVLVSIPSGNIRPAPATKPQRMLFDEG